MTTTQVPTNGFITPPAASAPQVPGLPQPAPIQGTPIQMVNQQPGYVQPAQGQPQNQTQTPPQEPAQQNQTPTDAASLAALLQAALAQKPAAVPAELAKVPDARPAWMQTNLSEFNVDSIEDPIIKSMAGILQVASKDIDINRVLGKALEFGDPSLIDLAYIQEKGGANAENIAGIAKGIVQAVNAKSEAITKEVHDIVGGEAQWAAATAVFNQQAPQEIRQVVAAMLDSTRSDQIKAAAKIVAEYGRASGHIPQQGSALLNPAAGNATGQGLSKVQFQAELRKLDINGSSYAEARDALFSRRQLGKRLGM